MIFDEIKFIMVFLFISNTNLTINFKIKPSITQYWKTVLN